jgi:hypothetical protein
LQILLACFFFVLIFSRNPGSIQEYDRLEDGVNFNSVFFAIALTEIYDQVGFAIAE